MDKEIFGLFDNKSILSQTFTNDVEMGKIKWEYVKIAKFYPIVLLTHKHSRTSWLRVIDGWLDCPSIDVMVLQHQPIIERLSAL